MAFPKKLLLKTKFPMHDFLIIGAGLAGLSLAFKLEEKGLSFKIIDRGSLLTSSGIAGGLINPVTGKNFKITWKFPELIEPAISFYQNLESKLQTKFFRKHDILRFLRNPAEKSAFNEALNQPEIANFLSDEARLPDGFIESELIKITSSYALDCPHFTETARKYFQDRIIISEFNFEQINFKSASLQYQNEEYQRLILASGYEAAEFMDVNFRNAKGEILTLDIPDLKTENIISFTEFLLPYKNHFKLGATYSWDELNCQPTEENKEKLLISLQSICNLPYKIIKHDAAVRPIVCGQKPVLGKFTPKPLTYALNGLGSKGALYAPYTADMLIEHIIQSRPIETALDLEIRIKKYAKQNNQPGTPVA